MKTRQIVSIFFVIALLTASAIPLSGGEIKPGGAGNFSKTLSGDSAYGFKRAEEVRGFIFPQDFGPHPEFQTEWWYYTGNLEDASGRRFGYQLTFFRRALSPKSPQRRSNWAANQIYFAHFTLSDIENGKFYSAEKWSREALELAGARSDPHHVWIGDWSAGKEGEVFELRARDGSVSLDLTLTPLKPIVLQGDRGLSQKGEEPGNASYYYSVTRLETAGTIKIAGQEFNVRGLSWLDREWSTSALGEDIEGWDWFSLQLEDGRDIMLYRLRQKDGGTDSHSGGSLVEKDGSLKALKASDFSIEVLDTWKSADTGVTYPSKWRVSIPEYETELTITPYQPNQELLLSFVYWEGAVSVSGVGVSGSGYVELTGYEANR